MEFSYGQGIFKEKDKEITGQIILGEHKLYLRGDQGDLAASYIPLEKIRHIKKVFNDLEISVIPSPAYKYSVIVKGDKKHLRSLLHDLVERRGLKKRFLKQEWIESES